MKKPKHDRIPASPEEADELQMRWAAFLINYSTDITSHAKLFERVIYGSNLPRPEDDEDWRKPAPRPRQPSPVGQAG